MRCPSGNGHACPNMYSRLFLSDLTTMRTSESPFVLMPRSRLRVPDSGIDWRDKMIERSRRLDRQTNPNAVKIGALIAAPVPRWIPMELMDTIRNRRASCTGARARVGQIGPATSLTKIAAWRQRT